ncbi:hypothetical protein DUNSADRAFT_9664 [Dunaliella salina]|uniref:E3 ubiquitin-protein ligase SHPRH first helical domain-containing protein n=1 Tax=Dunaliella salina TaxID=3046 RepID=A0ABQ7GH40_DUNSA|nr:hypothetical protein DUNSADRAFT_9664 [Dunaliella salina]|eukprot:KAF5833869.1 hypothetical protein DUNSADRAFT_9664 [Dunaliella salina]
MILCCFFLKSQVLVAKARVEAEEAQRALVASLNGLAALRLLTAQEPWQPQDCVDLAAQQAAAMYYSEAVQTMDTNKKDIDTDPLQRLHTLYNLAALLKQAAHQAAGPQQGQSNNHCSTSPALPSVLAVSSASWAALEAEAHAIRTKYLQQPWLRLVAQQHDFDMLVTSAGYNARPQRPRPQKQMQPRQGQLQTQQPEGEGEEEEEEGNGGQVQEANKASWFLDAIDMISSMGRQEDVKDFVKNRLLERDTYRQQTTVNASSIANRFRSLHGLKIVLTEALDGIERSRAKAMDKLQELTQVCAKPSPTFVEQAGSCHRCRSELGVRGRLCEHCKLDELQVNWEVNLFALYSRALTAGGQVSAEDAARRAHANNLQRVGRGGLGEEEAQDAGALAGSDGRRGEKVTETNIVWHPSEAEQVWRANCAIRWP